MCKMEPIKGRGAIDNPANRFATTRLMYDIDGEKGSHPAPVRELMNDHTAEIISVNRSPDIPFGKSVNPYRGCEHGCIYCYARPTHEYLGFSAGLDFESKIVVKKEAPRLLQECFSKQNWVPETVVMSGVTDPYQPVEKELRITRGCLEVFVRARHPLVIITKNHLVTRDIDLLAELAACRAVKVGLSITTLDRDLAGRMEPRTSRPQRRLEAVRELASAGIPVHVNVAPIIPGLTDHECSDILQEASRAGAESAGYTLLRLPWGVKELFVEWLEQHFPDRKRKVLNRILDLRRGKLNRSEFGERFGGSGNYAVQIRELFHQSARRAGLNMKRTTLSSASFRRLSGNQMDLFRQDPS